MAYRLTRYAEASVEEIIEWSAARHWQEAALRYSALIERACVFIGNDPEAAGSRIVEGFAGLRSYPLRLRRADGPIADRVASPRHTIIYHFSPQQGVEIVAILHDRMLACRAVQRALRSAQSEEPERRS